jgi:DNA invertase Pin-like site-specific DNA recombinase
MRVIQYGFDNDVYHLLVEDRKRWAREARTGFNMQHDLLEMGFTLHYSLGSPAPTPQSRGPEKFMDGIEHLMSQFDRDGIVERLSDGRKIKEQHPGHRAQGGALPFGYRRTVKDLDGSKGLVAVHPTYTSAELAELFSVARSTIYRAIQRAARSRAKQLDGVYFAALGRLPKRGASSRDRAPATGTVLCRQYLDMTLSELGYRGARFDAPK